MNTRSSIFLPCLRALPVLLLTAALVLTAPMLRAGEDEGAGIRPTIQDPAPGTTALNPIKVTMSSVPFDTIRTDGFIFREVVVQNESKAPATVTIRLRFTEQYYAQTFSRTVTTTRQIPANSRQAIPLFVPAGLFSNRSSFHENSYFNSANPQVFVNGKRYFPLPSTFMDGQAADRKVLPLPSSFSGQENLAELIALSLIGQPNFSPSLLYREKRTPILPNKDRLESDISGTDTIQWPAIPQFYQSKDLIFRKTSDQFTPDAERAIRDAVMLGATEVLFVAPGSPWPEWAPRPAAWGLPSIVARGFGQSVVIDASAIHTPGPVSTAPPGRSPAPDRFRGFDDEEMKPTSTAAEERINYSQLFNANLPLLSELQDASVLVFNPAPIFLVLPHVDIPSIPFIMVILALLAYIIVVGPVNYFRLVRKKKSVLLLLLTVPVISIVFVVVVIFFVGIVEGWSSSASAVGVTFLDQQENMAYTRAAVNLYAPVPVRAFTFDPADSVLFSNTKEVNTSLGRDQVITGANRARIPLAYSISRAEKHLEQLKVTRDASGISVVNGLGAPLSKLIVKTADGEIWTAPGGVATGESVRLYRYTGNVMAKETIDSFFSKTVKDNQHINGDAYFPFNGLLLTAAGLLLETPADRSLEMRDRQFPESIYGNELNSIAKFDLFSVKKCLEEPGFLESVLPAGMYMAETDTPLFYSPGCKPVSFRARHIVFGAFAAQEASHEN